MKRMTNGECIGLSVPEILSLGTYGRPWKEFTLNELRAYFAFLSPDFEASRSKMIYSQARRTCRSSANLKN
ncbi:MAG: hypothetical protein ACREIF_04670 [Chthoniobacterales bacterium]